MDWITFRNDGAKARLQEARDFADAHPALKESLDKCLDSLKNIASNYGGKIDLCTDFAPLSMSWGVVLESGKCPLNGGLIFHGPHDGGGNGSFPTLSVSLNPTHGWSLHT